MIMSVPYMIHAKVPFSFTGVFSVLSCQSWLSSHDLGRGSTRTTVSHTFGSSRTVKTCHFLVEQCWIKC